ncbi:MAG: hypothetical protein LUH18_08660 [Oscillospiraceae bacterium]|nr:hypothetical protein [Oscillospiraceae bacterium]
MYEKYNAVIVKFEENNSFIFADVSGGDMPVGEEEEEGWEAVSHASR